MAAASASETTNISGAWERGRARTSDVQMTAAAACWRVALARVPTSGLAGVMPLEVNRAPVLTLWAAMVAERLGHPADTALTLGRAVAGFAARVKARNIGREERKADRDADTPRPRSDHVTAPVFLLGKTVRLLPTTDGELRAADGEQPADPVAVQRYLSKAFGDHLGEVRQAMDELASRYEPAELNRIGFRLYEKFRPDEPSNDPLPDKHFSETSSIVGRSIWPLRRRKPLMFSERSI